MGDLIFRIPLDNGHAPRGATKKRTLFLLAILISTIAILIPDISFAISMDDPKLVAREMAQIEKYKDMVKREGDTLLLKSESGSYIPLKNSPGCENFETCFSFIFVDYFEDLGFFLVNGYYWEGGGVMMVSESDGKQYHIRKLPIFSPDRKRLVTVPDDIDAGWGENGIFLWRIESKKLIQEFSFEPMEYATYEFIRWKDNKHIELKKWLHSSKELCPENKYMIIPASLEMEDDGWKLYKYPSPDSVECVDNW